MSSGIFSSLDHVLSEVGGYPVLAWLCTPSGQCLDGNDTFCTFAHIEETAISHFNWLKLVAHEDSILACARWYRNANRGLIHNTQLRLAGDPLDAPEWDLLGTPQADMTHGTIWLFVAAPIRQYSSEIQKEHALQLEELQNTLDKINLFAWYGSAFGTVNYINKKLAAVFNIPEGHPIRSGSSGIGFGPATQLRFIPPVERPDSLATWIHSMKTKSAHNVEYRLINNDGSERWFQIYGEPMMDQSGEHILCWSGYCLETDRKHRANDELATVRQDLEEAIHIASMSEMASAVAHEVNQPLGAIAANAYAALRWLRYDTPAWERAQAAVHRIERDSYAAASIVSRLEALFDPELLRRDPHER